MAELHKINAEVTVHTATEVGDITVQPTEVEYHSDRYDSAAELKVSGLPDVDNDVISEFPEASDEPTTVVCRATNNAELLENNEDANDAGTIIGSGELNESFIDEDDVWNGTAFDAIRKLKQTTFSGQYEGVVINDLLEDILVSAGLQEERETPNEPDGRPTFAIQTPEEIPVSPEATGGQTYMYRTSREFNNVPSYDAITQVLESRNWWIWVTADNTVIIDDVFDSEEIDIPYIKETSAGKQTPPWQAVEVIGARQPEGADPATANGDTERIVGKGDPVRATAGNGTPVFTEVNRSIDSDRRAQDLANSILEELTIQQAGGSITALGDPIIRTLDGVRLPEHLGGEAYLVSELTHKINANDGFITEIECGGLIDPGEGETINTEDPSEEEGESGGEEGPRDPAEIPGPDPGPGPAPDPTDPDDPGPAPPPDPGPSPTDPTSPTDPSGANVAAVQQGWGEPIESMSSNFRNGSLEGKWGSWGDGQGCYSPSTWNGLRCGRNSVVENGMHRIEGTVDGETSGATSTTTFTYGRIEYRERAYCADNCDNETYNVTPIIYPANPESQIAGNGEMDIAERRIGDTPFFVVHWNDDNYYINVDGLDGTEWHNYAIEWLPNRISWYVDGHYVDSFDLSISMEAEYNAGQMDMFPPTGTPMHHAYEEIDWIKFYDYQADGPSPVPENDHPGGTDWVPTEDNVRSGIGWQG